MHEIEFIVKILRNFFVATFQALRELIFFRDLHKLL